VAAGPQIAVGDTAAVPICGDGTPVGAADTQWICTFDDEFSAATGDPDALDRSKWVPQDTNTSGYTTGNIGAYACYVDNRNNISVGNGVLSLTIRREPQAKLCGIAGLTQYTSGMVSTYQHFTQTYGRYEVRAKLPAATVKGLQETFWLYPAQPKHYSGKGASGELDFAEFYSQYPKLDIPYLHYVATTTSASTDTQINQVTSYDCAINSGDFNVYTLEWEPGILTIDLNGEPCLVDDYAAKGLASPAPFDQPFFAVLTQALGVGTNAFSATKTPLPATTQVDYVRIWRAASA
jgi:beta-glucanase (GH16 family)